MIEVYENTLGREGNYALCTPTFLEEYKIRKQINALFLFKESISVKEDGEEKGEKRWVVCRNRRELIQYSPDVRYVIYAPSAQEAMEKLLKQNDLQAVIHNNTKAQSFDLQGKTTYELTEMVAKAIHGSKSVAEHNKKGLKHGNQSMYEKSDCLFTIEAVVDELARRLRKI